MKRNDKITHLCGHQYAKLVYQHCTGNLTI